MNQSRLRVYTPETTAHVLDWLRNIVYALAGPRPARESDVTEIASMEQLDRVLAESENAPLFLFKHSTSCPISYGAHRRLNDYLQKSAETGAAVPATYLIKVIESRPISNAIAERLGVPHKSPQLLLVDHGRCRWNTSHYDITAENIDAALQRQPA